MKVYESGGLSAVEITRPANLRENSEAFLPEGSVIDQLIGPFTTSGSTGKAKRIYLSERDTKIIASTYFDGLLRGQSPIAKGELYLVSMLDRPGSLGRYIAERIVPQTGYDAEICSALEPERLADRMMQIKCPFVLRSGLPIASKLLDILKARNFNPRESMLRRMNLGGGIMSREASGRLMREFGIEVLGVYGMTEIGGDLVAVETEPGSGIYKFTCRPYLIQELVPHSTYPALHEVVLTVLNREGTQLIRYGTQDLVRLQDDGTTFEIVGRYDDEVIFGQMNMLWNYRVEQEIEKHLGTANFSIVLEQSDEGIDTFIVSMEGTNVTENQLAHSFVEALAEIDGIAERHFRLGYYKVTLRTQKPKPRMLGHKVQRFKDLRRSKKNR